MPKIKQVPENIVRYILDAHNSGSSCLAISKDLYKKYTFSITSPTVKRVIERNIDNEKFKSSNEETASNSESETKEEFASRQDPQNDDNKELNSSTKNSEQIYKGPGKSSNNIEDSCLSDSHSKEKYRKEESPNLDNNFNELKELLYSLTSITTSLDKRIINLETKLSQENPYSYINKQAEEFIKIYADKRQSLSLNLNSILIDKIKSFCKETYDINGNLSDAVNLAMLITLYKSNSF